MAAEVAQNISDMMTTTAANLAALNVTGFVGEAANLKTALASAAKMAGLGYIQTPGTNAEKMKSAAIMGAFMLTPLPAGLLPKTWQAIAANVAENVGVSAFGGSYDKSVPWSQKIPQLLMDTVFGAQVKGKNKGVKAPTAPEAPTAGAEPPAVPEAGKPAIAPAETAAPRTLAQIQQESLDAFNKTQVTAPEPTLPPDAQPIKNQGRKPNVADVVPGAT